MKIYSDTLTEDDIRTTARIWRRLSVTAMTQMGMTRLRARGWHVQLGSATSRRPFNSGTRGAGGEGAASHDDWGIFLAALYDKDEKMIAGPYRDKADFHAKTNDAYQNGGGIIAVSHRALSFALEYDPEMTACEVAWLDNGQLERLILACHRLADAAQAERDGGTR